MTSSLPIQPSPYSVRHSRAEEAPVATSFSRTLRAFAENEQSGQPHAAMSVAIMAIEKKRLALRGSAPPIGTSRTKEKLSEVPEPAQSTVVRSVKKSIPRPAAIGLLTRAWSWLQKNHALSVTKQLRVSDTRGSSSGEARRVYHCLPNWTPGKCPSLFLSRRRSQGTDRNDFQSVHL
jgi:hypothetical protein